ncbi:hypothetical protein A9255_18555 [Xenorhabdus hominickii]|uniref:Uncharacterized protein n=1 Tax=Xenorhabdus hominickii TaxID=351679 RepID=A0ABM6DWM4_XENHO|nr:hypothetical protein A9255_18555 [Xenorhabdus hominickii]
MDGIHPVEWLVIVPLTPIQARYKFLERFHELTNKETLKFTAEIELTDFAESGDRAVAFGKIFNDSKKRFEDGVEIITSLVTNTETYKIDGYIKTQNSIYKIRE